MATAEKTRYDQRWNKIWEGGLEPGQVEALLVLITRPNTAIYNLGSAPRHQPPQSLQIHW